MLQPEQLALSQYRCSVMPDTQHAQPAQLLACSEQVLTCPENNMATPGGLQPPTSALGKPCSMQLSYGATGDDLAICGRVGKRSERSGDEKVGCTSQMEDTGHLWLRPVNLPDIAVNKGRMGRCRRFGPDSFRACSASHGRCVNPREGRVRSGRSALPKGVWIQAWAGRRRPG